MTGWIGSSEDLSIIHNGYKNSGTRNRYMHMYNARIGLREAYSGQAWNDVLGLSQGEEWIIVLWAVIRCA